MVGNEQEGTETMLNLRSYQSAAIEGIDAADQAGVIRPLVVHPTGTGKTVTFSHLLAMRAALGWGLVLVHRDELAQHTIEDINMIAPELSVGLVKASRNEINADVVVASVDTVRRDNRLAALIQRGRPATVVVDEAHHAPAPSWMKVLTGLGSFSPYGPLTVGFTATPERDGKRLGVWERVVSYMSIREAIFVHNCLVMPHGQTVKTSLDLDDVRVTRGDYQDGSLGTELTRSGAIGQIADAYLEYAKDRKGLAFTPTIDTSKRLTAALRDRGIRAEHLDGTTPDEERRSILRRLHTGETQVVCNCAVLGEGFNEPSISCVVVARPTQFHGLYVQMVGRGLRKFPGKSDCLILDVTGASERHDLVAVVDLGLEDETRKKKPRELGEARGCPVCEVTCDISAHYCRLCTRYLTVELIENHVRQHDTCRASKTGKVNVFDASRLRWLPVQNGWCLGAGKEIVVMVPAGEDKWQLASYINGRITVLHEELPADWAQGIGEDRAKAFGKLVERDARWLGMPVTEQQLGRLVREGLPHEALNRVHTRGQAADLITRIQGRRAVRKLIGG